MKIARLGEDAFKLTYINGYFDINKDVLVHGYMTDWNGEKEYLCEAHSTRFDGSRANLDLVEQRPYVNFSGVTRRQFEANHRSRETLYMWIREEDLVYIIDGKNQPNYKLKTTLTTLDDIN